MGLDHDKQTSLSLYKKRIMQKKEEFKSQLMIKLVLTFSKLHNKEAWRGARSHLYRPDSVTWANAPAPPHRQLADQDIQNLEYWTGLGN